MHDETPEGKSDCLRWVQEAGFPKGICLRCGWPTAPQPYHAYGECINPPRIEMPPEFRGKEERGGGLGPEVAEALRQGATMREERGGCILDIKRLSEVDFL